jgi:hypothetical protein
MAQGSIGKKIRPPQSGLTPRHIDRFCNHGMYSPRRLAQMSAAPHDATAFAVRDRRHGTAARRIIARCVAIPGTRAP